MVHQHFLLDNHTNCDQIYDNELKHGLSMYKNLNRYYASHC